jgi:signal transduction histidine kinase
LGELFLNILLLSVLPTTVVALTAGLIISRRSGRRIDAIGGTLKQLTAGDLSARVKNIDGREDDLSSIARLVDSMAAAQQSSVNALRQVSADIAHDLKTPIQRVAVLLSKAREMPDLPEKLESILDEAGQETTGIVATFQSLLQISQIEGGSPKNRFQPVDLGMLAATFVEVYEPAAEETGHRIEAVLPGRGAAIILGEKGLLGQVLANLIENALRHTPAGSSIKVAVSSQADKVCLEVSDTGPGVPADERQNVLRRLYRLETSRTTPGNGLGLSLVAAIVDMHGGEIEMSDNEPGLRVAMTFEKASSDD